MSRRLDASRAALARWGSTIATTIVTACSDVPAPSVAVDDTGGETTGAPMGDESTTTGEPEPVDPQHEIAIAGLRRLSVAEYRATVIDLLGVDAEGAKELLPLDALTPFDNDYTLQTPSEALVRGLEILAGDVATAVVDSPSLRAAVVPCAPAGPDDAACFREHLRSFGRRALRRPLSDAELDAHASLLEHAIEADDFWFAVQASLRMFLQHPELVYRVEIGEPLPDEPTLHRLGDHELAARLSYFALGTTTPDWLLDAADAGSLSTREGLADAARTLLADPRARVRIDRFHALWLSYERLSSDGIFGDMRQESDALVERVVFDERAPWTDVLESNETFVTPALAEHYGLPAPEGGAGWVPYAGSGRMGLLSHGAFLSVGTKFGDTSPTQRGLVVRTALFCQTIPQAPADLMVDVDEPPPGSASDCKHERWSMAQQAACAGCHAQMDLIGFGLEAYDATGALRSHENGRPECAIAGDGTFVDFPGADASGGGDATFNGPAELARLAVDSGLVEACVARQLYRFAVGRTALDEHDEALLTRLVAEAGGEGGFEMMGFIEGYVTSDAFRHRRDAAE